MSGRLAEEPVHPAEEAQTKPPVESAGFGRLSRTIVRRTTDLLVIGILCLAFLSMGRKVSVWWRTNPEALTVRPVAADSFRWDDPQGMLLDLGDVSGSVRHQRLSVDAGGLRDTLSAHCQRLLASGTADHGDPDFARSGQLLEQLALREPDWTGEGGAMVHVVEGPCWLAAGTRPGSLSQHDANSAAALRVLVGLVLAFPAGDDQWAVFTIEPPGPSRGESPGSVDIPLPAGARLALNLRDGRGNVLLSFSGSGPIPAWQDQLTQSLAAQGWQSWGGWQVRDSASLGRFVRAGDQSWQMDIQLLGREDGCAGLIQVTVSDEVADP